MKAPETFLHAFFALPSGTFHGHFRDRSYVASRTEMAGKRSHKLVAHELGGTDYISLNLYLLSDGTALLRPCEMPPAKVVDFVTGLRPKR